MAFAAEGAANGGGEDWNLLFSGKRLEMGRLSNSCGEP
jgi:hypothetical protein